MAQQDPELARYLEGAHHAANAAAQLLLDARPDQVRNKGNPRDLVTEWDLRSEAVIRQVLRVQSPEVAIVGEEEGADDGAMSNPRRWLVDPIDGTVNFAHGLPFWAISIALEDSRGPAVGIVVAPQLGWSFFASRGGGSFMTTRGETTALHVSTVDRLEHAMLVTGFPYDRATSPVNNFAEWEHFQRQAGACRRLGAASLDLCMVARGWLDGYWERKLKPWDIGAGAVIVLEAGGRVTDTQGGAFDPHAGEIIASNGGIHEAMVEQLAVVARGRSRAEVRS